LYLKKKEYYYAYLLFKIMQKGGLKTLYKSIKYKNKYKLNFILLYINKNIINNF
jgi:hypothetical protein